MKESVTPQQKNDRAQRQGRAGGRSRAARQRKKISPIMKSYVSGRWPRPEAPKPLVGWPRRGGPGPRGGRCTRGVQRAVSPRIHWLPIHGIRTHLGVSVLLEGERRRRGTSPRGEHKPNPREGDDGAEGPSCRAGGRGGAGARCPESYVHILHGLGSAHPEARG